ncbi:MAG: NUDIX domain-containing protein [Acidobacteriia bacterium]|nr:NUDIX domain-containing protein [Terriglobia bacterium]
MPNHSAGLLMYRRHNGVLEFFLVHPGGPFWARKEDGVWSIPKGELGAGEDPLAAAKREFEEETGLSPSGDYIALTPIKQPGGKIIHAWAFESDCDPATLRSNTFSLEWPPRSGRQQVFPEVDRAGWFNLDAAKSKILRGQAGFLDTLHELLSRRPT